MASRSEALAEPKDPRPARSETARQEAFSLLQSIRKFLDAPVTVHTDMGSFDCIVVRNANDVFAQDDRS